MIYQFINDNNKNIITNYINNSLKNWSPLKVSAKVVNFNSFKETINLFGDIIPPYKLISFLVITENGYGKIIDSNILKIEIDSNDTLRKVHTLTKDSIFNEIDLSDMRSYLIKFIRDRKIEEILL